jgi:acyl-CoA thioesterase
MLDNDLFSRWLGIELIEIEKGFCKLKLVTRPEMLNGFELLHGGICYSLADSALAFAANSYGYHALSVETSISYHSKVFANEELVAEAKNIFIGEKFSTFQVDVLNASKELVSSFKGTVYNSSRIW